MCYNGSECKREVIVLKNKQNLHTHSTYADGKDTPEEMILEAIARGFDSIGFSEHSYMPFSTSKSQLKPTDTEKYRAEIYGLKAKYKDQIDIFCGIEFEFNSAMTYHNFDYMIGSVHYLDFGDAILGFDRDLPQTLAYIQDNFGGNAMAFARRYYETLMQLPQKGKFDILGHFDLMTKNNEQGKFIDTNDKKYLDLGFEAIHALKGEIPLFEVNTGAVARGYRTAPYPQMEFMKEFRNCGYGAVITSDCHDKNFVDCFFEESRLLLQEAGFTNRWLLTDDGFEEVEL